MDKRKPKPWRMGVGMLIGLLVGGVLWWSAYEPGLGLMQKPQLLLVPSAAAAVLVALRNKLKKVGDYDPETIARNRKGRV